MIKANIRRGAICIGNVMPPDHQARTFVILAIGTKYATVSEVVRSRSRKIPLGDFEASIKRGLTYAMPAESRRKDCASVRRILRANIKIGYGSKASAKAALEALKNYEN